MRAFSAVFAIVLTSVLSAGCLRKDVTQTIYVSPSAAIWSVIEKDVRSDETATAARIAEEQDYLLSAGAGKHPVAQAFRRLGALSVTTTWLRRGRPYTVLTEARFASLEQVFKAVLRDAQLQAEVSTVRVGCETRLTVKADLSSAPASSDDSALDALIGDLEDYRIVLAEGRFVSADGFRIVDDGTIAVPDQAKKADSGILLLNLVWADEGCAGNPWRTSIQDGDVSGPRPKSS